MNKLAAEQASTGTEEVEQEGSEAGQVDNLKFANPEEGAGEAGNEEQVQSDEGTSKLASNETSTTTEEVEQEGSEAGQQSTNNATNAINSTAGNEQQASEAANQLNSNETKEIIDLDSEQEGSEAGQQSTNNATNAINSTAGNEQQASEAGKFNNIVRELTTKPRSDKIKMDNLTLVARGLQYR